MAKSKPKSTSKSKASKSKAPKPKASKSKTKGTPSVPKSLRKGVLPRTVDEVWTAGIGALAQARKAGADSFDALVALGGTVVDKGTGAAKTAVGQVGAAADGVVGTAKDVAGGAVDTVQDGVEAVVEAALGRLGVPGRDEVLALRVQVEALQSRIAELSAARERAAAAATERTTYEVAPHERGWAVRRAGADRATAVHPTKKQALQDARQTARAHAPSLLVVYKLDGQVSDETEYDPD